jgi:hypothetical protein
LNIDPTIAGYLLRIESLVVDKRLVAATAERELSKGDWLSDHNKAAQEIEFYFEQIRKYS